MLNYFKRPQISSVLFVAASLATFILLGALFIFLKINWLTDGRTDENSNERYYFKNTDKTDPLITKMPDINNMLAGPIISQNDPNLGSETAPIVIVEFSDFLCRFCQEQEKILSAVIKKYPDKIEGPWGIGAMIGMTICKGDGEKSKEFTFKLFDNGALSFIAGSSPTRVRFLLPMGVVTEKDIDNVVAIIEKTLNEIG